MGHSLFPYACTAEYCVHFGITRHFTFYLNVQNRKTLTFDLVHYDRHSSGTFYMVLPNKMETTSGTIASDVASNSIWDAPNLDAGIKCDKRASFDT